MLLFLLLPALDVPGPPTSATSRAVWLADVQLHTARPGYGRFVFVPGSAVDEIDGHFEIEAAGSSPGVLHTLHFAAGEKDEGLDVAQPIVVEGVLTVIRHPARG